MALVHYSKDLQIPGPDASREVINEWADADRHERDYVRSALFRLAQLAEIGLAALGAAHCAQPDDHEKVYAAVVELAGMFIDSRRDQLIEIADAAIASS